jgi:hypothetical protein
MKKVGPGLVILHWSLDLVGELVYLPLIRETIGKNPQASFQKSEIERKLCIAFR